MAFPNGTERRIGREASQSIFDQTGVRLKFRFSSYPNVVTVKLVPSWATSVDDEVKLVTFDTLEEAIEFGWIAAGQPRRH